MATRRVPSVRVQMDSKGFSTVLASAFFEWLLIFLLFVHAVFSYLLTSFARACTLQIPCLLCSRLDHVIGNERPGFCWNLICKAHKLQISSMLFCSVHDKLADADGLCETCLVSSAAGDNKSNSLGAKMDSDHAPILTSLNERHCSCCDDLWTPRLDTEKRLDNESMLAKFPESDSPSPVSSHHTCENLQDLRSKKIRQRTTEDVGSPKLEQNNFSAMHHVGYSELKIHSDSESEVTISDDFGDDNYLHQKDVFKQDFISTSTPLDSPIIKAEEALANDLNEEKLIHPIPTPSNLVPNVQLDVYESSYTITSKAAIGHGLEELNWNQLEQKPTSSVPPTEFTLLNHVASSPEAAQDVGEMSGRNIDISETVEIKQMTISESEKVDKLESGSVAEMGNNLRTDQRLNETAPAISSLFDLNDAYKLVVKNKGAQASSMFAEQISKRDSSKESEDLKLLLSQISSARGLESPLSELSPRMLGQLDELKISDASSSSGIQMLQKKISLERNESGLSMDGSNLSEIEGESLVDRLKRQVEYDRKSLSALYKELEEERNAAAVAATQALAMITRLQEEKATLQMEALQYLRMMEEQAEYDMEALQKTNDLLADKEKEVQDLEAEMQIYRMAGETVEDQISDYNGEGLAMEQLSVDASCGSCSAIPSTSLPLDKKIELHNGPGKIDLENENKNENASCSKESLADLGDEKLYISQCLKKLEQQLHLLLNSGTNMDKPSGGHVGKEDNRFSDLENDHYDQSNIGVEYRDKYSEEESQNGSRLVDNHQPSSEESHQFVDSINHKKTDLVSLGVEILDLNERLSAIEADQNFLEHVISSLKNGDGAQFIREIALHLRELRGLGIRRARPFLE
ncbi:hypothetical protein Syun_026223 [Stephania yunnanensis]|uniref:GTD-binding domain-containing protein n=1 Tax=Stephania yunnanensis TaxID=152371 RepID=A0AAP0HRZ7_9MAGN